MDFKRLSNKAKDLVEKRGGTEALKQDAEQLRGIAKGPGTFSDKAKAAVSAIKDPGAREADADASPAATASGAERERAGSKVDGEARGKHAGAGGDGARKGRGRRRREEAGGDVGAL